MGTHNGSYMGSCLNLPSPDRDMFKVTIYYMVSDIYCDKTIFYSKKILHIFPPGFLKGNKRDFQIVIYLGNELIIITVYSGNNATINSTPLFLLERNPRHRLISGFIFVSFNSATNWLNVMAYNSLLQI